MSYQVLARKWRPKNFKEMAGQDHVLQTLVHALESGRLHHAYLFTGTRGVGKTTIARILAKCLNCEQGVTAVPCEQCDSCREIAEGRFIDLIEVDAASRTKVEDTRELLENVQYAPSRGRFKVYLIDEVHMLSTHSFNALLKTLEEPPPHVKFLLATTDPQKLPVTILSRCLQFNLKNFMPDKIVDYLQTVLIAEQISFEEPALWHLARAAHGSMRDALTLLDQAISFGQGTVSDSSVQALLGTPSQLVVFRIMHGISTRNAADLLACAAEIAEHNANYYQLLENLLSVLHRTAIAQVLPRAVDNSNGDRTNILELAGKLSPEDIQLYYQIGLKAQQDFSLAPDLQMAFEMFLLRLLAFTPEGPVYATEELSSSDLKLDTVIDAPAVSAPAASAPEPAQSEQKKKHLISSEYPSGFESAPPEHLSESPAKPASDYLSESIAETAVEHLFEQSAKAPELEVSSETLAAILSEPQSEPVLKQAEVLTPEQINTSNWMEIVSKSGLSGISANLLANCVPELLTADRIELLLDEKQSSLFNEQYLNDIGEALSTRFNKKLQVSIRVGVPPTESPAAYRQRARQEHRQAAIENFINDATVIEIVQRFSATIKQESLTLHSEDKP
jgi:DNA polymerase-3 subunit gamma/tau